MQAKMPPNKFSPILLVAPDLPQCADPLEYHIRRSEMAMPSQQSHITSSKTSSNFPPRDWIRILMENQCYSALSIEVCRLVEWPFHSKDQKEIRPSVFKCIFSYGRKTRGRLESWSGPESRSLE